MRPESRGSHRDGRPLSGDAHVRTDWAGTVHPVAGSGARIACVVPSITELLFALGLGDSVVARSGFCVHPRDAIKAVRKIGGTKDFDLDALRVLRPTHLVVNVDENRKDAVDAARAFVPHVIVTHPGRPEDNPRLYALLGGVFGRVREAQGLAAEFDRALAALDAAVRAMPREKVLYLIWRKPWMTVAPGTYIGATLAQIGWDTLPRADSAMAGARYPELGSDQALWREADRILLSSEPYAFRARDVRELSAQYGQPVHLIDGEMTSWYGSRAIVGMRYLARFRLDVAASRVGDAWR